MKETVEPVLRNAEAGVGYGEMYLVQKSCRVLYLAGDGDDYLSTFREFEAVANQVNLSISNQAITNWPPGAALWLVWQMTDSTGKAQGLAIDNLSFSATAGSATPPPVPLGFQTTATNLVLSWTGVAGQTYQVEYKDDLAAPGWTALGNPLTGTGSVLSISSDFTHSAQRYYRLRTLP